MSAGLEALRRALERDPEDDKAARELARGLARAASLEEAFFLLFDRGVAEEDPQLTEIGAAIAATQRPFIEVLGPGFELAHRAPKILEWGRWERRPPRSFLQEAAGPVLGLSLPHAAGAEELGAALSFTTLLGLDLYAARPEVMDFKALRRFARLRFLNLSRIENAELWLPGLTALSSLRSLVCRDLPVTAEVLRSWGGLRGLRRLDLSNTGAGAGKLAALAAFTDLEALNLSAIALRDPDFEALAALPALRCLELGDAVLVGDGLGKLQNLRELRLNRVGIGAFTAWSALSSLESLTLRRCTLGDEAAPALGALSALKELNLVETRWPPEGLPRLAELPSLRRLSLRFCELDMHALRGLLSGVEVIT